MDWRIKEINNQCIKYINLKTDSKVSENQDLIQAFKEVISIHGQDKKAGFEALDYKLKKKLSWGPNPWAKIKTLETRSGTSSCTDQLREVFNYAVDNPPARFTQQDIDFFNNMLFKKTEVTIDPNQLEEDERVDLPITLQEEKQQTIFNGLSGSVFLTGRGAPIAEPFEINTNLHTVLNVNTKLTKNSTEYPMCMKHENPSPSSVPISIPTSIPSAIPVNTPMPTGIPIPSPIPSAIPLNIPIPTGIPIPSSIPSNIPTSIPTSFPTGAPNVIASGLSTGSLVVGGLVVAGVAMIAYKMLSKPSKAGVPKKTLNQRVMDLMTLSRPTRNKYSSSMPTKARV